MLYWKKDYLYEDGRDIAYKDIEKGLGYKQMQRYLPIKLKEGMWRKEWNNCKRHSEIWQNT